MEPKLIFVFGLATPIWKTMKHIICFGWDHCEMGGLWTLAYLVLQAGLNRKNYLSSQFKCFPIVIVCLLFCRQISSVRHGGNGNRNCQLQTGVNMQICVTTSTPSSWSALVTDTLNLNLNWENWEKTQDSEVTCVICDAFMLLKYFASH